MSGFTRRDVLGLGLAAVPFAMGAAGSTAGGVQLAVNLYSFRELLNTPGDFIDKSIAAMRKLGLDQCEVFEPAIQPPALNVDQPWAMQPGKPPTEASIYGRPPPGGPDEWYRKAVRDWRLAVPIGEIEAMGRKFKDAGIGVISFGMRIKDFMADDELDRGFQMAKALGTNLISTSTTLTMARRIIPFAERHGVLVAMHNHSNLSDPNQFATTESFVEALAMSPRYRINLDIGHYVATNGDPLAFIRRFHDKITHLHVKDRKRDDGPNMPMGQGDVPIKAVLRLLRDQHYPIPAAVEYEYAGTGDSVEETGKCIAYMKACLA